MTNTKSDKVYWLSIISLAFIFIALLCACFVVFAWFLEEAFTLSLARIASYIGLFICTATLLITVSKRIFHFQKSFRRFEVLKIFVFLSCLVLFYVFLVQTHSIYSRAVCSLKLRNLGGAIIDYQRENKQLPPVDKWCDIILDFTSKNTYRYGEAFRENLTCPSLSSKKCSYAMNPDARPDSDPETVLLFECKEGWNQSGGPEMATFENHNGECCVLFADGQVKCFVKKDFDKLKW